MSDVVVDEVRRAVAQANGLPEQAASLLVGTTLEELEASAGQLAELLTAHQADPGPGPEQSEQETMADVIARASFEKRERQAALLASLHQPQQPEQPRDEQGKFTARGSGGFGGGARPLVPAPKDPVQEHDAIVLGLTQLSHLGRSQF